jgi:hypothetical protein
VTAVAFVPSAPLLVPAVAAGSADLDADLRRAALAAVSRAVHDRPREAVVVAPTATAGEWDENRTWGFEGFGVDRWPPDARSRLPWPLGIGAWLLDECGWSGTRRYVGLAGDGARNAADDIAIIAVGDGSARRSERAPGHLDGRAQGFDDHVADCLASGDSAGLASIDPVLAEALMCPSVAVWGWVASGVDRPVHAELLAHLAPYGVGYFVALWSDG